MANNKTERRARRCRCVQIKSAGGRYVFTDKSNCFLHAPATAKHNKQRDELIREVKRKAR